MPNPHVAIIGSRVPRPEEITILRMSLVRVCVQLGKLLKGTKITWGIWGDASEVISSVNVRNVDHIEILTSKEGCEEICRILKDYVVRKPALVEKRVDRDADVDGHIFPIFMRSHYAELSIDNAKVEVHGDEQIKVGEWEWGDPLEFKPSEINVIGTMVPIVPLNLKSELYLGLGWLDRVALISDAVMASRHH